MPSLYELHTTALRRVVTLIAALVFTVVVPSSALAWQITEPSAAGLTTVVERQPSNPSVMLMGTDVGGLYRSADNGASWQKVRMSGAGVAGAESVAAVMFHPRLPSVAYALVGNGRVGGVLASYDAGVTWKALTTGVYGDANSYRSRFWDASTPRWPRPIGQLLQIDTGNRLYVGSFGAGVRKFNLNWRGELQDGQPGGGAPVLAECQDEGRCPNPAYVTGLALDDVDDSKLYVALRAPADDNGKQIVRTSSLWRVTAPAASGRIVHALTGLTAQPKAPPLVAEEIGVLGGRLYVVANPTSPTCDPAQKAGLYWADNARKMLTNTLLRRLQETPAGCIEGKSEIWSGLEVFAGTTQRVYASRVTDWEGPQPLLVLTGAPTITDPASAQQQWSGKGMPRAVVNDVAGPLVGASPASYWLYRKPDGSDDVYSRCRWGTSSASRLSGFSVHPGDPQQVMFSGGCTPMVSFDAGAPGSLYPSGQGIGLIVVEDIVADPRVPGRSWVATMDWGLVRLDDGGRDATGILVKGPGTPGAPAAPATVGFSFAAEPGEVAQPRLCTGIGSGSMNTHGQVWCTSDSSGTGAWTRKPLVSSALSNAPRPRGLGFASRAADGSPVLVAAFEGDDSDDGTPSEREGGLYESVGDGGAFKLILNETQFPVPVYTPVRFARRADGALYAYSARAGLFRGVRAPSGAWTWTKLASGSGAGRGYLAVIQGETADSAVAYITRPAAGRPFDGLRAVEDGPSGMTVTKPVMPAGYEKDQVKGLVSLPDGTLRLILEQEADAASLSRRTLWIGADAASDPAAVRWKLSPDQARFEAVADDLRAFAVVPSGGGLTLQVAVSGGVAASGAS